MTTFSFRFRTRSQPPQYVALTFTAFTFAVALSMAQTWAENHDWIVDSD